jgi:hypothetical protein
MFLRPLSAILLGLLGAVSLLAADVDWEPEVYPKDNLFPSLVVGTARIDPSESIFPKWKGEHYGDEQGVVGASISGLEDEDDISLIIEPNEFMKESRFDGTVHIKADDSDEDVVVHPKVLYDYDRLTLVKQVKPLDVTMELLVNGVSMGKKTVTITVRSVNDCLFGVEESKESNSDYSWLFAAYVNENNPWVDKLLKEALDTGIVSSFDGYQAEDDKDVLLQIFSIWNVMQRNGMKYSDITTTAAESKGVYSQHVRLFDDSIKASQANCVDGSVLMGALLRKIGLESTLVLVPGHMFLAVKLNSDTQIGLETTLMGEESLDKADPKEFPSFDKLAPELQTEAWKSFEAAVSVGTKRLKKEKKKFDGDDLQYQLINIQDAREMGILPISSGETVQPAP